MKKYFTTKNVVIATLIIIVLFLLTCGRSKSGAFFQCNKGDTLSHKIDTTVKENKDTSEVSFVPTQETDTVYIPKWYKKEVHDTLEIPNDRPPLPITDTLKELRRLQAIERAYNKKNFFKSDSIRDKNKRWVAVVRDTTQKNIVIGTGITVITTCYDTTIKESTTVVKHPIVVYIGGSTLSYKKDPFYGASIDLGIKGNNDRYYGAGLMLDKNGKLALKLEMKVPIRLFKKK